MQERWKPIPGYEGKYEVSDLGNVRSLSYLGNTGKIKVLSPGINRGYLLVVLWKDGKGKHYYVHNLVVTAFKGPIPPGMQINHINEDKSDNRLDNLEIVTPKENANWGTAQERKAKANSKELKLTNAKTSAKYTFPSSVEASGFFGYKSKRTLGVFIFQARQRGENFINIRGERHYFAQAD